MVVVEPDGDAVARFFRDVPLGAQVYAGLAALADELGGATVRVTRSQVAFRRRRSFGWVWLPGRYLERPAAEVVVSLALDRADRSPRWKEVTEVANGRWMHHLEVHSTRELDEQVRAWVAEAYQLAG